ncbi:hypothetical protein ACFVWZ_18785 [Streptomyces sp. NPDC058200]|uniref:hypothetical protein n=1 Tax=Streptomyces sp. NPDC058200 TaxID=3346378 RepID=UPI0036E940A6
MGLTALRLAGAISALLFGMAPHPGQVTRARETPSPVQFLNEMATRSAFWLVRPGRELVEQPVVFLGSEGETGVVARDLGAFLWLLADGFGPWEAATLYEPEPDWAPQVNRDLAAIAEQFAPDRRASAAAIIAQATQEFPDFDDTIMKLCR